MQEFIIEITEKYQRYVTVSAPTRLMAIAQVMEAYKDEYHEDEIVFTKEDCVGVQFEVISE